MRWIGCALAVMTTLSCAGRAAADYLLWTDNADFGQNGNQFGDIRRANLDGSGQTILVRNLTGPNGIAVDPAGGMMYWVDGEADNNTGDVRSAKLDGSGQKIIAFDQFFPIGIALDASAKQIYWIVHPMQTASNDLFGKDIRTADLHGAGVQTIQETLGVIGNGQLALDLTHRKIYTTDYDENRIRVMNIDGTGVTTLLSNLGGPVGLALDVPDGKMFWAENTSNSIYEANLDGSGKKAVLTGLSAPAGLTLDLSAGKMYWTDYGTNGVLNGDVRSANLDGTNVQVLAQGQNGPFAITLVPEPSIIVFIGLACGVLLRRSPHRPAPSAA